MATLKEFEDLLRQHGMTNALAILDGLRQRDREKRSIAPARRIAGRKMTAELARSILDLHATTGMTQQEIAFRLGVNQGRVNEVIKRGKWLSADPHAPEALSRDRAMDRLHQRAKERRVRPAAAAMPPRPVVTVRSTEVEPARQPEVPTPVPATASLPLGRTEAVRPVRHATTARPPQPVAPSARPTPPDRLPPSGPIVSAQLAFLDL